MNFDYLEDFIKVVECKSLNKASQELNISTPALSKRMKSIETYFKCDLFFRTSKGIFLTKNGELVYKIFREMYKSLEIAKTQLDNSLKCKWKLGIIPSFSLFKLHNKHSNFENIATLTIENSTSILLEELYKGNIDVLIGDLSHINSNKLFVEKIYTENYIVVYGDKDIFKSDKAINIQDIKKEKIYIQEPPCDTYNFIKLNDLKEKLNISYKKYYESILANVKAGKGITLMPQSLTTRIDTMNLYQKKLKGYKRVVGVASYNQDKTRKVYNLFVK